MADGRIIDDIKWPRILSVRSAARSKLFEIEAVHLQFSNGFETEYERVSSAAIHGAVVVVPLLDHETVLLVREYAVGVNRYEVGLPKGLIRADESALEAANRELAEEVGHIANRLSHIYTLSVAPGFLSYSTDVVLATNLVPQQDPGDEPEVLEIVPWSLRNLGALIATREITDSRSVAALFLAKEFLEKQDNADS